MKKFLLILMLLQGFAQAQPTLPPLQADSLWAIWSDEKRHDTSRLQAMHTYIWEGYMYSKPDSAFYLAKQQYDLAILSSDLKKFMAIALNTQGATFLIRGNYEEAIKYFMECLQIYEELVDKRGMAISLNNIGMIYNDQGDYGRSLNYFMRSLKLYEEIGDKKGRATSMGNIGGIYQDQIDFEKALEYYNRSLKLDEELDNQIGIATSLSNIGFVYQSMKRYDEAIEYFTRSLAISEEVGDIEGISYCLNSIGIVHKDQGNYTKALEYCKRSLKISEEIGGQLGIASSLRSIGNIYLRQNNAAEALIVCQKALALATEIGVLTEQKEACNCLYDAYKATGNGLKALEYHELMLIFTDSLRKEEISKQLQQMEFTKQMLADSLAQAEEKRLIQKAHKEEVRQRTQTRNITIGVGVLTLILAGGLYSRLRFMRQSRAELQIEKDRSESLLLNILPEEIARELKEKGEAEARGFDLVSILFTDFKSFTETSAKLSAGELVSEINHCFKAFDGIIDKYKIEKIKTIGDAYMAAGGLPIPTDDSVKNTVLAALEMQVFINERQAENLLAGKPAFEMRVGIHTGPVVAGIVGVKKFQYDIWGDTVNTASRIETNGAVGRVNVSQATYEYLKDDIDLVFESRGKIEAKGKGEIEMYFVSKK